MLALLNLVLGPAVQLSLKIADLILARQQASTDIEKAKIDEAVKQLSAQRDVIAASQQFSYSRDIYWTLLALGAIGPIAYIFKYLFWDKVIGGFVGCAGVSNAYCRTAFSTDAITDPNIWWVVLAVFSFLYLTSRK